MKEMVVIPKTLDEKEQQVINDALLEYINHEKSDEKKEIAKNMLPSIRQCYRLALTKIEHTILKTALFGLKKLGIEEEKDKYDPNALESIINEVINV